MEIKEAVGVLVEAKMCIAFAAHYAGMPLATRFLAPLPRVFDNRPMSCAVRADVLVGDAARGSFISS